MNESEYEAARPIGRRSRKYHLAIYQWELGDSYDRMLERQGGHCADCPTVRCRNGGPLHVDHDHHTGRVRGLVCPPCNYRRGRDDAYKLAQDLIVNSA